MNGTDLLFETEGLELGYGRDRVLEVGTFVLRGGERLVLLGQNGSGKTTFLKALNGLMAPLSGTIRYRGQAIQGSTAFRAETAYLHQSPYLLAGSVSYNVSFALRCRGVPARGREEAAEAALARLGLDGYGHRPRRKLSGGEAQRVALARVLASGARVLLLDEPTASADAASARIIERVLLEEAASGATLVVATHHGGLAEALATRTISFVDGRMNAEARP